MDRRTLTMNWDDLGEGNEDDEFFESTNRLSAVVPLDFPSSGSDDDEEFDDSRMSFASTISSDSTTEFRHIATSGEYDMWMAQPGSINDRRRKLLQGMGLNSNKDLLKVASSKLNKELSSRELSRKATLKTTPEIPKASPLKPPVLDSPASIEVSKVDAQPATPSPAPVLLVRSRSDGDIDTCSLNTKQRKEEMIGKVSKQRLTRTNSGILTPSVGVSYQYANTVRVSSPHHKKRPSAASNSNSNSKNNNNNNIITTTTPNGQIGSFFLIKNLDTGKEFIVKEFNNEGMWNKVSDLQTGKQLTMDEFEKTVGHSPVVKELMRRGRNGDHERKLTATNSIFSKSFRSSKKRGAAILKNIRGSMSGLNALNTLKLDKEKDNTTTAATTTTTATDISSSTEGEQKPKEPSSQWVKARAHGKPMKEFTALFLSQEIQAHDGSIWAMRFTYDGHYLATGGEDRVIHVWEVQECDVMSMKGGEEMMGSTPVHPMAMVAVGENKPPLASEKKKNGKNSKKKGGIPDYVNVPETVFGLSEVPLCTLKGHQDDVLDLSWSRSQLLLSSSMDKTVRLWDIETKNCLKLFAHNDYVTCIQFNPADDDYFISGSLDAKVRIWNIPCRKVVDWTDLHEMVTAVCYSADGQVAIVGSHKGTCRLYSTTDSKLEHKDQVEIITKKKSQPKKITGFQFSQVNPSEVLVTSADSRIRILDGANIIHKFKGYKNTSSQFAAEYSPDGKYIISASEDSEVYIYKHDETRTSGAAKIKCVTTACYEHFPCREVSVAIPWPGSSKLEAPMIEMNSKRNSKRSTPPLPPSETTHADSKKTSLPPLPKNSTQSQQEKTSQEKDANNTSETTVDCQGEDSEQPSQNDSSSVANSSSIRRDEISSSSSSNTGSQSWSSGWSLFDGGSSTHIVQATAWGMVIVTAGLDGEIRTYQNFGLPCKVGRQTTLF